MTSVERSVVENPQQKGIRGSHLTKPSYSGGRGQSVITIGWLTLWCIFYWQFQYSCSHKHHCKVHQLINMVTASSYTVQYHNKRYTAYTTCDIQSAGIGPNALLFLFNYSAIKSNSPCSENKPTRDAMSGIFLFYYSLLGDAIKTCWEFPTF